MELTRPVLYISEGAYECPSLPSSRLQNITIDSGLRFERESKQRIYESIAISLYAFVKFVLTRS